MPEKSVHEKIRPSLLDRLTDEDPVAKEESRLQRVITPARYLATVLRDLRWLLSAHTHLPDTPILERPTHSARRTKPKDGEVDERILADFPEVANSVIAYGLPDLTGVERSRVNLEEFGKVVEKVIRTFEPRVNPATVRVQPLTEPIEQGEQVSFAAIGFEIQADVFMEPIPEHLHLKTTLDLETGECQIVVAAHGSQVH